MKGYELVGFWYRSFKTKYHFPFAITQPLKHVFYSLWIMNKGKRPNRESLRGTTFFLLEKDTTIHVTLGKILRFPSFPYFA